MKKGYIILELLLAFAISSMVMGALFTTFNQTNKAVAMMDRIASIDMRTLLLQNQMEIDLSGAFVPQERQKKEKTGDKDKKKDVKKEGKQGKKEEEFEDVPLKKAFFVKDKGANIELLTFITTNPLPSYGALKPRIVRVLYKVVPEKATSKGETKPSFKLLRQEHETLSFAKFEKSKAIRPYEVIKNIKKITAEYTVSVEKDQEKEKKGGGEKSSVQTKGQAKEPKIEFKTLKKWGKEQIKKTKKQKPDMCKFKVELWDDLRRSFKTFEFDVYMPLGQQKQVQQEQGKKQPGQRKPGQGGSGRPGRSGE